MTTNRADFIPVHIVTLDQEQKALVAVINGSAPAVFDPAADIDRLPQGGGYVVADGNAWAVRNELSQSQYCWPTQDALDAFLNELSDRGYRAVTVANKLANTVYQRSEYDQADAVRALYDYVHAQTSVGKGRDLPGDPDDQGQQVLGCGSCTRHYAFDSGHPVRPARGDKSFGQRDIVSAHFLRVQNTDGYTSAFAQEIIDAAWHALDRDGRKLFNLAIRTPTCSSPNRLMAVASCTHDPFTGQLRTHNGQPWGVGFITRHVIGLSGAMRGTGEGAPGNPMRAVLRVLGRRHGDKVNREERAQMDRYVRVLIRAFQERGDIELAEPA